MPKPTAIVDLVAVCLSHAIHLLTPAAEPAPQPSEPDPSTPHTPGPWQVCGGMTPHYKSITSNEGYIVFSMADSMHDTEHRKPIKAPGMDRQAANARLIASAPKLHEENIALLDACRAALKIIVAIPNAAADSITLITTEVLLRDAIARAES